MSSTDKPSRKRTAKQLAALAIHNAALRAPRDARDLHEIRIAAALGAFPSDATLAARLGGVSESEIRTAAKTLGLRTGRSQTKRQELRDAQRDPDGAARKLMAAGRLIALTFLIESLPTMSGRDLNLTHGILTDKLKAAGGGEVAPANILFTIGKDKNEIRKITDVLFAKRAAEFERRKLVPERPCL